jgi:glycosyltransferase involved in cell wall biosynthesis
MPDLTKGKATICIVNYKTLEFIRLCLRSIRKFTGYPYKVIVVDNGSADPSLDYLRSLNWIHLIEADTNNDVSGSYSHARALDIGLENCDTEFFVSMHSDTFVTGENWLANLVGYFGSDERTACVGSGKVELEAKWRTILKKTTDFRTFKRKLLKVPDPLGKFRYYNRTICCLYRTNILRRENLTFLMDREKGLTAGKKLYFELVDLGYKTVELPPEVMSRYVIHLAHATQVVNPQEFTLRKKTRRKCHRLVNRVMSFEVIKSILEDDSLDA